MTTAQRNLRWMAIGMLAGGVFGLILGVVSLWWAMTISYDVRVTGTVVDHYVGSGDDGRYPVVEFTDSEGNVQRVTGNREWGLLPGLGSEVELVHPADRPQWARPDTVTESVGQWLAPLVALVAGLGLLAASVWAFLKSFDPEAADRLIKQATSR